MRDLRNVPIEPYVNRYIKDGELLEGEGNLIPKRLKELSKVSVMAALKMNMVS